MMGGGGGGGGTVMYIGGMPYRNQVQKISADQFDTFSTKAMNEHTVHKTCLIFTRGHWWWDISKFTSA